MEQKFFYFRCMSIWANHQKKTLIVKIFRNFCLRNDGRIAFEGWAWDGTASPKDFCSRDLSPKAQNPGPIPVPRVQGIYGTRVPGTVPGSLNFLLRKNMRSLDTRPCFWRSRFTFSRQIHFLARKMTSISRLNRQK